jgi:hypothetical protein
MYKLRIQRSDWDDLFSLRLAGLVSGRSVRFLKLSYLNDGQFGRTGHRAGEVVGRISIDEDV